MELRIKTGETRNVTARDLSRRIGALLDQIDEDGDRRWLTAEGERAAATLVA